MASVSEVQPSPEMKEQTLAVYNQVPSRPGEEATNISFTWTCRSSWKEPRVSSPVQKMGIGVPTTTALGCNFHVSFLNLSFWQNTAF